MEYLQYLSEMIDNSRKKNAVLNLIINGIPSIHLMENILRLQ